MSKLSNKEFLDKFLLGALGKCYFNLTNGNKYQGWITEITESTFEFEDSGL